MQSSPTAWMQMILPGVRCAGSARPVRMVRVYPSAEADAPRGTRGSSPGSEDSVSGLHRISREARALSLGLQRMRWEPEVMSRGPQKTPWEPQGPSWGRVPDSRNRVSGPRRGVICPRNDAPCPRNGGPAQMEAISWLRGQVRSLPGYRRGARPDVPCDGRRKRPA